MAIFVIYNHTQRRRATDWLKPLIEDGLEFDFAPLGFEIGSKSWMSAITESVANADAGVALLTKEALDDDSVTWRVQLVREAGKPLFPVVLDEGSQRSLMSTFPTMQWLIGDENGKLHLKRVLSQFVRKQPKCFMSYSREDVDFASKLSVDLREKGVEVWRDDENIRAGEKWDKAIENALRQATHVLFVVSPRSVASRTVSDEISLAIEDEKVVIPCIIESAELPMRVRRHHCIDFATDYETPFNQLLRQLREWSDEAA